MIQPQRIVAEVVLAIQTATINGACAMLSDLFDSIAARLSSISNAIVYHTVVCIADLLPPDSKAAQEADVLLRLPRDMQAKLFKAWCADAVTNTAMIWCWRWREVSPRWVNAFQYLAMLIEPATDRVHQLGMIVVSLLRRNWLIGVMMVGIAVGCSMEAARRAARPLRQGVWRVTRYAVWLLGKLLILCGWLVLWLVCTSVVWRLVKDVDVDVDW